MVKDGVTSDTRLADDKGFCSLGYFVYLWKLGLYTTSFLVFL